MDTLAGRWGGESKTHPVLASNRLPLKTSRGKLNYGLVKDAACPSSAFLSPWPQGLTPQSQRALPFLSTGTRPINSQQRDLCHSPSHYAGVAMGSFSDHPIGSRRKEKRLRNCQETWLIYMCEGGPDLQRPSSSQNLFPVKSRIVSTARKL